MNAIRGDYFGRLYFGTISGFMDMIQMFGLVLGPIFAGWIFDVTDSYRLAFITFAIAAAIAMVLMLIARRPVPKEDRIMAQDEYRHWSSHNNLA